MSLEILDIPIQSDTVTPSLVQGDTIPAITVVSADFPDLTTSTIAMQLYYGNKKVLDIDSTSGITVSNATTFVIDEITANDLPVGESIGDLQITDASGVITTYFRLRYTVDKQYTI